jgi:hypothetical protein
MKLTEIPTTLKEKIMLKDQLPSRLYLEHLYSEYSTSKSKPAEGSEAAIFIEELYKSRHSEPISWNDIYRFELILADYYTVDKLRGKVVRLRYDLRSIVGQKEFDDYLASKPPDLQSPPDPKKEPDSHINYDKLLREDIKDLLGRLYMQYAILPVKEKKLVKLTGCAASLCALSLMFLLIITMYLFVCSDDSPCRHWSEYFGTSDGVESAKGAADNTLKNISSLTIIIVVVSGVMGGFVSALQRIQAQPSEGDSIYNLSLLFYGSNSVFVAPITGAIFAILLYLMFTSQVLTGAFFPDIYTPPPLGKPDKSEISESQTVAPSVPTRIEANTNATQSKPAPPPSGDNSQIGNTNNSVKSPTPTPALTPTPTPVPTPTPIGQSLKVVEFLSKSGPRGGTDYALLILWCFIAGFAERFVPDVLDRFISRNGSGGGNKT